MFSIMPSVWYGISSAVDANNPQMQWGTHGTFGDKK